MSETQTIHGNIVQSLRVARNSGGATAFAAVHVVENLAAFQRIADGLSGFVAGVVAKPAQWGLASDNAEDHVEKLEFVICLRLTVTRAAGMDDNKAIEQMDGLAAIVRKALLADPTRGGSAAAITFEGHFLPNTDLRGPVKLEPPRKPKAADGSAGGHAFYDATLPVICGRRIDRTQASYTA